MSPSHPTFSSGRAPKAVTTGQGKQVLFIQGIQGWNRDTGDHAQGLPILAHMCTAQRTGKCIHVHRHIRNGSCVWLCFPACNGDTPLTTDTAVMDRAQLSLIRDMFSTPEAFSTRVDLDAPRSYPPDPYYRLRLLLMLEPLGSTWDLWNAAWRWEKISGFFSRGIIWAIE